MDNFPRGPAEGYGISNSKDRKKMTEFVGTPMLPHGNWTVDTLGAYLTQKINDHDQVYNQRFKNHERTFETVQAMIDMKFKDSITYSNSNRDRMFEVFTLSFQSAEKAVSKSESANEIRFQTVNEFRAQLSDQAAKFITRVEVEQSIRAITDRMAANQTSILDKLEANIKSFTARVDDLKAYKDSTLGKGQGLSAGWAILLGLGGLIFPIIMTVHNLMK